MLALPAPLSLAQNAAAWSVHNDATLELEARMDRAQLLGDTQEHARLWLQKQIALSHMIALTDAQLVATGYEGVGW